MLSSGMMSIKKNNLSMSLQIKKWKHTITAERENVISHGSTMTLIHVALSGQSLQGRIPRNTCINKERAITWRRENLDKICLYISCSNKKPYL